MTVTDHPLLYLSVLQADLKVNPSVWSKLSDEAKTMITALLNKNPRERISARDALHHPFIVNFIPQMRRNIPPPGFVLRSSSRDSVGVGSSQSAEVMGIAVSAAAFEP